MNELYLVLAGAAGVFMTKLADWVFSRKSTAEDVRSKEIDNEVKFADYYKTLLDDLSKRYEAKFNEVVALFASKERILKDEISLLTRKNKMLQTENAELHKRVFELEAKK